MKTADAAGMSDHRRTDNAKLHAPAAERNASHLIDLLRGYAPRTGSALELASGTGQHVVQFARAFPDLMWQPTDVDIDRLASIDSYAAEATLPNLRPARVLDATRPHWHRSKEEVDLVVVVNLLHLIATDHARTVIFEAMAVLGPAGRFILYGPFRRDGELTSTGDRQFDARLCAENPDLGYKNDRDIIRWLTTAGATDVQQIEMPANNLAFVATR